MRPYTIQTPLGGTRRTPRSAVTLFELLVVLAVAGILTAIFIYSARYLITNTRISRVREEHRVLTRALQNYEADYGEFPTTAVGLKSLNGPIAYMVRVPADPFSARESKEYAYIRFPESQTRWILISRGPDGDSDLLDAFRVAHSGSGLQQGDGTDSFTIPAAQVGNLLTLITYDPTNGLNSGGDIVTVGR